MSAHAVYTCTGVPPPNTHLSASDTPNMPDARSSGLKAPKRAQEHLKDEKESKPSVTFD